MTTWHSYAVKLACPLAAVALIAAIWSACLIPPAPPEMAMHFTLSGHPNDFGTPGNVWLAMTGLSCAILVLIFLFACSRINRVIAAILGGATGIIATVQVVVFRANAGATTGSEVALTLGDAAIIAAGCIIVAAVAALPGPPQDSGAPETPPALDVPKSGSAAWSAQVSYPRWVYITLAAAFGVTVILVVATSTCWP